VIQESYSWIWYFIVTFGTVNLDMIQVEKVTSMNRLLRRPYLHNPNYTQASVLYIF